MVPVVPPLGLGGNVLGREDIRGPILQHGHDNMICAVALIRHDLYVYYRTVKDRLCAFRA
jgi:hypothetical protein